MAVWVMLAGVGIMVIMLTGWFGTVINESVGGLYNAQVDKSFRMGMFWFIFSEVMFFAAFFGALFYARNMSVPWLGGDSNNFFTNLLLWEGFEATWPTNGPGEVGGDYEAMGPFGLPLINTAILLTSSITVTIAHHALLAGKRGILGTFLALTFILGFIFVYMQAVEYIEAYEHMNLKLTSGIYGSTFFMLTGFHGMHVTNTSLSKRSPGTGTLSTLSGSACTCSFIGCRARDSERGISLLHGSLRCALLQSRNIPLAALSVQPTKLIGHDQ